jgi:UDP-N-acetylglucosamine 2-epimerase
MLAGTSSERILEAAKLMVKKERGWVNPFGDGKTAEKIISILMKKQFL